MPFDNKFELDKNSAFLLIIDIQDRLAAAMQERDKVIENNLHLIELAKLLDIPILITEQYPKGLGSTVQEIKQAVSDHIPIEKLSFNCCASPGFGDYLEHERRNTAIVTGMETHICVLQTVLGLLKQHFNVHVVSDAVCSRTKENRRAGLDFMRDSGAVVSSTEIVLFQLLGLAGSEEFKTISKRIK
jgi:nicotinamidase-related amidase